ncbi:hypothetical protein SEVIR_9G485900v4 [Setaria viridis]|uniref:Uncharacterized protein n=1 Tax=Setaria viridis TaxID=4556 RepID=A0A4U6T963_SETVI|nr:hypothetical protein SEVIR_9G485900v2 [Setaria viridis]
MLRRRWRSHRPGGGDRATVEELCRLAPEKGASLRAAKPATEDIVPVANEACARLYTSNFEEWRKLVAVAQDNSRALPCSWRRYILDANGRPSVRSFLRHGS